MARLELRHLTKRFGDQVAVEDLSLKVADGEFLTLLGASGCGKSTTLRLIAGLVAPDLGKVLLDGEPVQHRPVHRRETAMVFQSYALFPHMTVRKNVAFGLLMRGATKDVIASRVSEALRLVELEGLDERFPRQLSGGQQQRVALARALVIRPKVLLLDEPLSNLDAKLRERLRLDLAALQRRLGLTTIYVTHDQAEALALSDRIALMAAGRIVEVGAPEAIYRNPHSRVTAEFLGIANLLEGRLLVADGECCMVETRLGRLSLAAETAAQPGEQVAFCLRPEDIRLDAPGANGTLTFAGRIRHAAYMGSLTDYLVELEPDGMLLRVHTPGSGAWPVDSPVSVTLPRAAALIREADDPSGRQ
jgi:ABC-type Fe3+/spermidine/putrescine transport system ATPase subunit